MSADDQRAADDGWTPIPETAACPAECEDCQVTVDRLRAELAETRAAGAALAEAARLVINGQGTNDALIDLSARAVRWRSVRGDAPAPAGSEQPAVVTQNAGEARRQALGIDGTMGDAQDVPHPYVDEGGTWASCLVCGLARGAVAHAAERRGDAPAEPPAAGPGGTSVVRSGVGRGFPRVHGRCPACRSASLFLAVGDHVTCASLSCPNPTAVADQLDGTVEGIAAAQAPADELPVTLSSVDDGPHPGDVRPGPCPECGDRGALQRWRNAGTDEATCGACGCEYWVTTLDGDE